MFISTRKVEPVFVEVTGSEGRWRKCVFRDTMFGLGALNEATFKVIQADCAAAGTDWRDRLTDWLLLDESDLQVLAGDK